jgi:hypothetical protein
MRFLAAVALVSLTLSGTILVPALPAAAQTALYYSPDGQTFTLTRDIDFAAHGEGQIDVRRGVSDRLKRVSVYLQTNGELQIRLSSFRETHHLKGRWRSRRNGRLDVQITEAFQDRSATGRGDITFRPVTDPFGNTGIALDRIRLSGAGRDGRFNADFDTNPYPFGRSGKGRDWDNSWNPERGNGFPDWPGQPGRRDRDNDDRLTGLTTSRGGRGDYQGRRGSRQLRQVDVILRRDGAAQLIFHGDNRYIYEGAWLRNRSGEINIIIRDGTNGATGRGTIRLNRNNAPDRIALDGSDRNGSFRVDFRVGRGYF